MGDSNHGDFGGASRHYSIFFRVRLYRAPRVGHLLALFGVYDGFAFTLKHDGHVRVDIFYRGFSPRFKALVNLIGGLLFLIPFCLLIFFTSWDYVLASWVIRETSAENNGLPFIYLLKTLMLLMPVTLLLQGIAEIIRSGLILSGADVSVNAMTDSTESTI